jgi:Tol biopolymer transport system component
MTTFGSVGLLLLGSSAWAGKVRYTGEGHAMHHVWSVDGRYVAFEVNSLSGGDASLYIAEVQGDVAKDATRVALPGGSTAMSGTNQVVVNPTWMREGYVLFEGSTQGGNYRIYYRAAGGGQASELIPTATMPGDMTFPMVSPDGKTTVFVSDQTGNGDIRTRDTGTSKIGQVTQSSYSEMFPIFSPDNTKIVYTRKDGGGQDVFEIPVAGGTETEIAGGGSDQTRPNYADDTIVYFDNSRGNDLWDLVSFAGGTKKTIARDVRLPHRGRPAVTTDGDWVSWAWNDPTKGSKIMLARVDGTKTVTIDTAYTACGEPALTKQGDRILLAYTALPSSGASWRFLTVVDVTEKLQ